MKTIFRPTKKIWYRFKYWCWRCNDYFEDYQPPDKCPMCGRPDWRVE